VVEANYKSLLRLDPETPKNDNCGSQLDSAVNSEGDEQETARSDPGADRHKGFDYHPSDCDDLEPERSSEQGISFQCDHSFQSRQF